MSISKDIAANPQQNQQASENRDLFADVQVFVDDHTSVEVKVNVDRSVYGEDAVRVKAESAEVAKSVATAVIAAIKNRNGP